MDVCRLCLNTEDLVSLFDKLEPRNMREIIYKTTGVKIKKTDTVTQKICKRCCFITTSMYKVRNLAARNDSELKSKLEQSSSDRNASSTQNDNVDVERLNDLLDCNAKLVPLHDATVQEDDSHESVTRLAERYPDLKIPAIKSNVEPLIKLKRDEVTNWLKKHKKGESHSEGNLIESHKDEHNTVDGVDRDRDSIIIVIDDDDDLPETGPSQEHGHTPKLHQFSRKRKLSFTKVVPQKSEVLHISVDKEKGELPDKSQRTDNLISKTGNNKSSEANRSPKPCTICKFITYNEDERKHHRRSHFTCLFCKVKLRSIGAKFFHMEKECPIRSIMQNLPTVPLVRIEEVKSLITKYKSAFEFEGFFKNETGTSSSASASGIKTSKPQNALNRPVSKPQNAISSQVELSVTVDGDEVLCISDDEIEQDAPSESRLCTFSLETQRKDQSQISKNSSKVSGPEHRPLVNGIQSVRFAETVSRAPSSGDYASLLRPNIIMPDDPVFSGVYFDSPDIDVLKRLLKIADCVIEFPKLASRNSKIHGDDTIYALRRMLKKYKIPLELHFSSDVNISYNFNQRPPKHKLDIWDPDVTQCDNFGEKPEENNTNYMYTKQQDVPHTVKKRKKNLQYTRQYSASNPKNLSNKKNKNNVKEKSKSGNALCQEERQAGSPKESSHSTGVIQTTGIHWPTVDSRSSGSSSERALVTLCPQGSLNCYTTGSPKNSNGKKETKAKFEGSNVEYPEERHADSSKETSRSASVIQSTGTQSRGAESRPTKPAFATPYPLGALNCHVTSSQSTESPSKVIQSINCDKTINNTLAGQHNNSVVINNIVLSSGIARSANLNNLRQTLSCTQAAATNAIAPSTVGPPSNSSKLPPHSQSFKDNTVRRSITRTTDGTQTSSVLESTTINLSHSLGAAPRRTCKPSSSIQSAITSQNIAVCSASKPSEFAPSNSFYPQGPINDFTVSQRIASNLDFMEPIDLTRGSQYSLDSQIQTTNNNTTQGASPSSGILHTSNSDRRRAYASIYSQRGGKTVSASEDNLPFSVNVNAQNLSNFPPPNSHGVATSSSLPQYAHSQGMVNFQGAIKRSESHRPTVLPQHPYLRYTDGFVNSRTLPETSSFSDGAQATNLANSDPLYSACFETMINNQATSNMVPPSESFQNSPSSSLVSEPPPYFQAVTNNGDPRGSYPTTNAIQNVMSAPPPYFQAVTNNGDPRGSYPTTNTTQNVSVNMRVTEMSLTQEKADNRSLSTNIPDFAAQYSSFLRQISTLPPEERMTHKSSLTRSISHLSRQAANSYVAPALSSQKVANRNRSRHFPASSVTPGNFHDSQSYLTTSSHFRNSQPSSVTPRNAPSASSGNFPDSQDSLTAPSGFPETSAPLASPDNLHTPQPSSALQAIFSHIPAPCAPRGLLPRIPNIVPARGPYHYYRSAPTTTRHPIAPSNQLASHSGRNLPSPAAMQASQAPFSLNTSPAISPAHVNEPPLENASENVTQNPQSVSGFKIPTSCSSARNNQSITSGLHQDPYTAPGFVSRGNNVPSGYYNADVYSLTNRCHLQTSSGTSKQCSKPQKNIRVKNVSELNSNPEI